MVPSFRQHGHKDHAADDSHHDDDKKHGRRLFPSSRHHGHEDHTADDGHKHRTAKFAIDEEPEPHYDSLELSEMTESQLKELESDIIAQIEYDKDQIQLFQRRRSKLQNEQSDNADSKNKKNRKIRDLDEKKHKLDRYRKNKEIRLHEVPT